MSGCCADGKRPQQDDGKEMITISVASTTPSIATAYQVPTSSLGNGQRQYLIKVILLGDSGTRELYPSHVKDVPFARVGKTSLMKRFVEDRFPEDFKPTIGVDFAARSWNMNGSEVRLQIWDTAGQERYRAIASTYYRGAHAAMIVFDLTNEASLDGVQRWMSEIQRHIPRDSVFPVVVVGNKVDLTLERQVSSDTAQRYLAANGIKATYIEASAKDNTKVPEAFEMMAQQIVSLSTQAPPPPMHGNSLYERAQDVQALTGVAR